MSEEYFPKELIYDKGYSWILMKGETAEIGITKQLADATKEFVFINLPKKVKIEKGEVYVSLESVKWTGHLESPVSGEITEVNNALFNEPAVLNKNPYGNWIIKVKISNKEELKELMDSGKKMETAACAIKRGRK